MSARTAMRMSARRAPGNRLTLASICTAAALAAAGPAHPESTAADGRRPWAFLKQHGISAVFEAGQADLYRQLLPPVFGMPDRLLVLVTVVHYDEVTPALVPYHEAYVMLRCRYRGETGLFALTMPVDEATANVGGRQIGFPKYVADRITLTDEDAVSRGEVVRDGRTVLSLRFSADGSPPAIESSEDRGLPCFTLVPRDGGSEVLIVRRSLRGPRVRTASAGRATVATSEPWGKLLEGAILVSAHRETISGDSIFVLTLR